MGRVGIKGEMLMENSTIQINKIKKLKVVINMDKEYSILKIISL